PARLETNRARTKPRMEELRLENSERKWRARDCNPPRRLGRVRHAHQAPVPSRKRFPDAEAQRRLDRPPAPVLGSLAACRRSEWLQHLLRSVGAGATGTAAPAPTGR